MKIETNISKNYFARFDEARGVALHKKSVLKNRKSKTLSYTQSRLIVFIILFILSILSCFLPYFNLCLFILPWLMFLITFLYLIYIIIDITSVYIFRKRMQFSNTILIDKNGITDESYYGIKMIFNWSKIKGVVIGKRAITILTDTPIYFYFDISKKAEVIKAIEKYGNSDLIIE